MCTNTDLLCFFDRPMEPCFMQKGKDKSVLQIPEEYFPEKYKKYAKELCSRFSAGAGRTVTLRSVTLPDLDVPMQLPYNDQFSLWVPKHRKMSAKLIDAFMGMSNLDDLMSVCAYCQMRINPYMFNYCLSVAMLHRDDCKGVSFPTFAQLFPDKFVDPKTYRKAREVASTVPDGNRMPIVLPQNYTAAATELEQRVAYFREDIGINMHHWHWHLVYPFEADDITIVAKDRRGELFYYMHQQLVARYNAERLCNGLGLAKPYGDLRSEIPEAYFPKLDSQVASRSWPPRFPMSKLHDLDRPADEVKLDISQLEAWRDRYLKAIEDMSIIMPDNSKMPLDEETGIDTLGNMMESSYISPNRIYYGDLHNMGHLFLSFVHDPEDRYLEKFSVMGDTATSMRDPIFYRWHTYVDNIFVSYKNKLTPYTAEQLEYPDITVTSIALDGSAGTNRVNTLWEQSTVELSGGLDFAATGSILAKFTHLQHDEYEYVIEVNNSSERSKMGMFRLFLAPAVGEDGKPLHFDQQRRLMIEIDKFSQALSPGSNTVRHRSQDSSVTIPYERTFRNQADRSGDPGSTEAAQFDFCGCGWPQHMLIPKGTDEGYPMVLFCMVSNWNEDTVVQDLVGSCNDASAYCGIRDRRYPDKRAMGFPLDRRARSGVVNLQDFLTPNMAAQPVTIKFSNVTRQREQKE